MSSLQMPKVDSSILSKKDKIVSDIGRIINPKNVLSHPDELRPFETDGLTAYRQMPLVVVMPETVMEVSNILKYWTFKVLFFLVIKSFQKFTSLYLLDFFKYIVKVVIPIVDTFFKDFVVW